MTLCSVSTLSVEAFDAWIAAAGGAPLSKCERSPTPPQREFGSPLFYNNPLTRSRSRSRSHTLSPSPSSLEPTTPMDRYDAVDYGFEVEADPMFTYELGSHHSNQTHPYSPKQKKMITVPMTCPLERCTSPRTPVDSPRGPPTPYSPTAAQRYAAAHRTSLDQSSHPASPRSNSLQNLDEEDEKDAEGEGIIWFGKGSRPSVERIELFQNWVGVALDPTAPEPSAAKGKRNPQLMQRLVGAWRQRRRRQSSKD